MKRNSLSYTLLRKSGFNSFRKLFRIDCFDFVTQKGFDWRWRVETLYNGQYILGLFERERFLKDRGIPAFFESKKQVFTEIKKDEIHANVHGRCLNVDQLPEKRTISIE